MERRWRVDFCRSQAQRFVRSQIPGRSRRRCMTKSTWKEKLVAFLEPEPMGHPKGEELYVPRKQVRIVFWIDGGPKVVGHHGNLVLNFNDPDLMVLSLQVRKTLRIYRFSYSRLACVELVHGSPDDEETAVRKVSLN